MLVKEDTSRQAKRLQRIRWRRLPEAPICPKCSVACLQGSTQKRADGITIQYRYCPKCRYSMPTEVDPLVLMTRRDRRKKVSLQ